MDAGGEIDLNGLDSLLKSVESTIKGLNTELGRTEKSVKNINGKEISEFRSSLQNLEKTIFDLKYKVKDGEVGMLDFVSVFKKMRTELNNMGSSNLPITGLIETVGKLKEMTSSLSAKMIAEPYKEAYSSIKEGVVSLFGKIQQYIKSTQQVVQATQQQATAQQNVANAAANTANAQQRAAQSVKQQARQLNAQKLHVGSITAAMQRTQQLIMQGNTQMISSYLKQEMSISRLNNALSGVRAAQENCNLATKKGQQEYAKLEKEAQALEFLLNRNVLFAQKLKSAFSKMGNSVQQVAMSFGIMTGVFGATNFVKQLYKITAEFQLQQRALGAIIQNTREANVLFKQMQSLAVESPMKFMDLNRYAKQLAAFRIETNELYNSLKMLGDISVGVGVDMDRLILAYGQVKAANYLRGQELRQFSEAGVNILGGLKEYYRETKNINMSINEIFDSVSKRKVLFEDVDAVLHKMTESGGEFYNMQLIQSQTLYGQLQKLGDLFQIQMNEIGSSMSGMLLGIVKIVQFFIRHLREVVAILVTWGGAKMLGGFVAKIVTINSGLKLMGMNLLTALRTTRTLNAAGGLKGLIAGLTASALRANLLAAAIQIALTALAGFFAYKASQRAKREALIESLIEEFAEYQRRLYDVKQIEDRFRNESPLFKDRLVALQDLIEKSKEYQVTLSSIQGEITPENINDVFANASKELEAYIQKVNEFKAALATPEESELAKEWGEVNTLFATAAGNADELFKYYHSNREKLNEEQKAIVYQIEEINRILAKELEDRTEEEQKYLDDANVNSQNWKYVFLQRIKDLQEYEKVTKEFARVRYGKTYITKEDVYEPLYAGDDEKEKAFQARRMKNVENFLKQFEQIIAKSQAQINKDLGVKGSAIDLSDMIDPKSGHYIKEKVAEMIPALKDAMKEMPDIMKENIPSIVNALVGGDENELHRFLVELDFIQTDAMNAEFQKFIDKVIEDPESGFKTKMDIELSFVDKNGNVVTGTPEQLKEQGLIGDALQKQYENTMQIAQAAQKAAGSEKEKRKAAEDAAKLYVEQRKQVVLALASGKDQKKILDGVNAQLHTSFKTLEGLKMYLDQIIGNGKTFFEWVSWDWIKETTTTSAKSMKSEYQSMIDFVRELNREFDTLRKNFNEKDSAKWAGATNRILSSFEAKFGAMPAKFKNAFQKTLSSIDFTTKEGTVQAENIVKGLIDSAKDLTPKEKEELQRAWGEAVGQIKLEAELELKAREDERLKAQVQKMFDDYNLTIELDKLGVDADEVGKLFNIDTKDLLTLERKLESMKEEFVGRNMEKEYRKFMRKIVEINDKANLEMAKKYVKYLREEYNERAKVELEYMRQRADVYALPFDKDETMRILDNLQKETKKKLDEIDWKTFTGSDTYIELFEDLSKASVRSMDYMIDQLKALKSSLSSLDPSNLKTIVDQIEKLEDELIKRDPFKVLSDSMKSWREFRKDEKTTSLINEILGRDSDAKINDFRNTLNKAIEEAKKKVDEARNKVNLQNALFGAAKQRDEAANWAVENIEGINWDNVYNLGGMQRALKEIEEERDKLSKRINAQKLIGVTNEEGLSGDEKLYLRYSKYAEYISKVVSALEALQKTGDKYTSASDLEKAWKDANGDLEQFLKNLKELESGKRSFDKIGDAAIEAGKQLADMASNMKNAYTSINEYLDSIGIATGAVGEAWKELGSTMFDTIIQALQMIPAMVVSIVEAETAINAAAGWIGLIAEAITIVMNLAKSLAGLHDAYKQEEIDKLQKSLDRLEKTANNLDEAFDDLFDEDRLRAFDAALIKTRELEIATLEAMMAAEKAKKKSDQTVIDGYQEQIDSLTDDIQDGINKFYESLGGFGSEANMKSMAESWTDAWYEAFKETGDGLSGLEDSFDEFIDNLYKKTILNKLSEKYFKDLYTQLDSILATEGGLTNNLDVFNDWIGLVQNAFDGFNEDATAAMNALSNVYGAGGGLEGLQASLQGMTEETADILAAYLNSVRFYVADNNQLLQNLYNVMAIDNDANPMLQQLKIIAAQTTAIHNVFDSVVSFGDDVSGNFVKVKISQ